MWRLGRGEAQTSNESANFVWFISGDAGVIRYSSSLDEYEFNGNVKKKNWFSGVFEHNGVFRKEEKDWKMVYLCRNGKKLQKKLLYIHNIFFCNF